MEMSRINLNAASQHELTQLPRIGADKARRIVHQRAVRKGFRDWADFAETPGVTQQDVEAIRTRAWIGTWEDEAPAGTVSGRAGTVKRPKRSRTP